MGRDIVGIRWYAPKLRQAAEVKVTKSSIVFTESGVARLHAIDPRFAEVTHVRLGWDSERGLVAVAPAPEGEKGHFKIGRRGRSQSSRTVNASKFFEAFALTPASGISTDCALIAEDGVALFRLNLPAAAPVGDGPPRRRRGRAPKAV